MASRHIRTPLKSGNFVEITIPGSGQLVASYENQPSIEDIQQVEEVVRQALGLPHDFKINSSIRSPHGMVQETSTKIQ